MSLSLGNVLPAGQPIKLQEYVTFKKMVPARGGEHIFAFHEFFSLSQSTYRWGTHFRFCDPSLDELGLKGGGKNL